MGPPKEILAYVNTSPVYPTVKERRPVHKPVHTIQLAREVSQFIHSAGSRSKPVRMVWNGSQTGLVFGRLYVIYWKWRKNISFVLHIILIKLKKIGITTFYQPFSIVIEFIFSTNIQFKQVSFNLNNNYWTELTVQVMRFQQFLYLFYSLIIII